MFNLASLRYRNVLEGKGGPIAALETNRVIRRGKEVFIANACLRAELAPKRVSVLFGAVDGSGTNASAAVARHIAVSEAIERWALLSGLIASKGEKWGLGIDPTSNGFAAYPGVSARQARRFAWLEAAERWSLFAWWEGCLRSEPISSPVPGVHGIRIASPLSCAVVVLFSEIHTRTYAYGYAAGGTLRTASDHAMTELDRHAVALNRKHLAESKPLSQHESRALFFGGADGYALFRERVSQSATGKRSTALPTVIFDGEIRGEWERYAHVWRVAFAPPSHRFLTDGREYFWW